MKRNEKKILGNTHLKKRYICVLLAIIALEIVLIVISNKKNGVKTISTLDTASEETKEATVALSSEEKLTRLENATIPDYIDQQIIDISNNSRSGWRLDDFNAVVIHYTANPGATAQQNHDYFANEDSNVASNFIVGIDGEIIQCLPLNERSAASNSRNGDTLSIEVCHVDESGEFTQATYDSLVKLTAYLIDLGQLDPETGIIRHYDITGKICPKYFVDHEDAWEQFKKDVANY